MAVPNSLYRIYGNIDLETALKDMDDVEAARELALDHYGVRVPPFHICPEGLIRPSEQAEGRSRAGRQRRIQSRHGREQRGRR